MSALNSRTYIDTGVTGLTTIVQHNLDTTPDIFITEFDGSNERYVSLMDSRIAEIKVLDSNNIQFSFALTFQGYVEFLAVKSDNPSNESRITRLEERYTELLGLIESKTSIAQWSQMNTLVQSQISSLQTQLDETNTRLAALEAELAAL